METAAPVTAGTEITPSAEADLLPLDGELTGAFQRVLDDALKDGNTQGAVLSVHVAGYEPWFGAGGHADVEQMRPMEPLTPYHIGSITKLFTAVVVMQLVQEGKIQLDAPLDRWLPGIVPDADSITVRQLLNHTSGIPDYLQDHRFIDRAYEAPDRIWMPDEIISHVVSTMPSPSPTPEKQWVYSNTNYVLLGVLVEQVTGNTLAEEIRQRILDPLRMTETFFPPDEAVPPYTARGYVGSYALAQGVDSFVWATGNIVSTTGDMQRFAEALFRGELLEPSTLATMLDVVPALPRHGLNTLEYGLGVMRTELLVGADAVTPSVPPDPWATQMPLPEPIAMLGHNGGWAGFRAALWYVPEIEATIVVGLNQAQTGPMPIVMRIVEQLMALQ